MGRRSLLEELDAVLSVPVLRGPEELLEYERDFGGFRQGRPLAVARAGCEPDVVHALRLASDHGLPVALRGAGHTGNGQTLAEGGLVLQNFATEPDVKLDAEAGTADVAARSAWLDVRNTLVRAGRACPVLTDYLKMSVGGTLSAGGYGARSIAHGAQIDNVERLRLVLRDGRALWCSPAEKPELFRLALAGQGAAGVIERALIRTVVHRRRARIYAFHHRGLSELADSLAWLEDFAGPLPDLFVGARRFRPSPGFTVSQYGFDLDEGRPLDPFMLTPLASRWPTRADVWEDQDLMAHARTVELVDDHPDCLRLWGDYVFGYDGFTRFTREVESRLSDERLRAHLTVIGLLIHRSPSVPFDFPFAASRAELGRNKYMVGFYFFPPRSEPGSIDTVRHALDELSELCIDLGGRPYRYGYSGDHRRVAERLGLPSEGDVLSAVAGAG